jgi:hypothetical protein
MHAQTWMYSTVIFKSCNSYYTYNSRIMTFDTRDLHLATATHKLVGRQKVPWQYRWFASAPVNVVYMFPVDRPTVDENVLGKLNPNCGESWEDGDSSRKGKGGVLFETFRATLLGLRTPFSAAGRSAAAS